MIESFNSEGLLSYIFGCTKLNFVCFSGGECT